MNLFTKPFTKTIPMVIILLSMAFPVRGNPTTADVPGDANLISSYTDFFYNNPSEDFFYYLNDRLLFFESLEDRLLSSGSRPKLLKIIRWHKLIKISLRRIEKDIRKPIRVNLDDPDGEKQVTILLNLLGLKLEKTLNGKYKITQNPAAGLADYYRFMNIKTKILEAQLNKGRLIEIRLKESQIPVPFDFDFLSQVTGLRISSKNFFETLLKNKRFSLFLGVLYRLSDREIEYISGMDKTVPLVAWKRIYRDKKLLAGMFVLSAALRVDRDGGWMLPGGPVAKNFWSQLAGKNPDNQPVEFLESLAAADNGKLNYLYVFTYYLPPETQQIIFQPANAEKMKQIYRSIPLGPRERLSDLRFPNLRNSGFFTMLYALKTKDGRFYFPRGLEPWMNMLPEGTYAAAKLSDLDKEPEGEFTEVDFTTPVDGKRDKTTFKLGPKKKLRRLRKKFYAGKRKGLFIRVLGGGVYSRSGDFRTMMDTNKDYYSSLERPSPVDSEPFYLSYNAGIGYSFGNLSFSLEYGRIFTSYVVNQPINYLGIKHTGRSIYRFSAKPLLLNLHLKVIDRTHFKGYIMGSAGIFQGRYSRETAYRWYDGKFKLISIHETATQTSPGFRAGASFDLFITRKLALTARVAYQIVAFNNMTGDGIIVRQTDLSHGTELLYEGELNFAPLTAPGFAEFYAGTETIPVGTEYRKASLSLNGFALHLGLKWFL